MWAIAVSHFCSDWGFFTLLTSLPTFLSDVLGFEIRDDGLLSALPFAVMAVTVIFAGYVADFLRRREILSTTNTRKLMNSVGEKVSVKGRQTDRQTDGSCRDKIKF